MRIILELEPFRIFQQSQKNIIGNIKITIKSAKATSHDTTESLFT